MRVCRRLTLTSRTGNAALGPLSVVFDASQSTDPWDVPVVRFVWDFGDGSEPAEGKTLTHVYTVARVYTVTLTATNEHGATASISAQYVANNAGPRVRITSPINGAKYYNGQAMHFAGNATDAETSPDALQYHWEIAGLLAAPSYTRLFTVANAGNK